MAISYVHPSVSSTITDNSTTYITASGTTKLFAVFTSEKGIDNEIQTITSASEFIFNYGEPNMKLYGQAGYNIVNWLNAGGAVYCLRVLPEDAGYANAIVNIQTKKTQKEVLDVNGELVVVDNVELRPCITYTNLNNTSKTEIESELRRVTAETIDGYTNNMLFAVIPNGRGKGYNNLGFRFSLTEAYDSTYEFRLYNFEVTQTSSTGSVSVIQGPFLVSLDPDAMSNSGSSFFITDVIDNYCDYFTVIFNEDNYEKLAKLINPEVHPNKIDFFSGLSRQINGEYETYYDERTNKEEDIHMSVIRYTDDGKATNERNIIDASDAIENSIALIDNAYRNEQYERYNESFERSKEVLSIIKKFEDASTRKVAYNNIELDTIKDENGKAYTLDAGVAAFEADNSVAEAYDVFEVAKGELTNDVSEATYNIANAEVYALSVCINALVDQLYELFDYARISQGVDDSHASTVATLLTDLQTVEGKLKSMTVAELNCNKHKNTVSELSETFNNLNVNSINSEKEEFIYEVIGKVESILATIKNISDAVEGSSNTFADSHLEEVETALNVIKTDYDTLTDDYTTAVDYEISLESAWRTIRNLLKVESLYFTINLALLENKSVAYNELKEPLNSLKARVVSFINTVKSEIGGFDYAAAKTSIVSIQKDTTDKKQETYYTVSQNFDNYVSLLYGTDGSIEDVSYRDHAVEKLIIEGYKGMIDDSLTDKEQWPIDMVLDANYSANIKSAIAVLCTELRTDFMGILDTELQATPGDAINYRKSSINFNNYRLAIFTQDFVVSDSEYTGNEIRITPTYFLASKIPSNDNTNGIHWNFVGPRRGTVTGFKSVSFLPNVEWRERLYNAQINYVQQDQISTRFNSQLTSQHSVSALSNISCVRTLLRIQRDVEDLMKNYQFEFNDSVTITNAQTDLSAYLNKWIANRACDSISGTVYASDYDRQQKLLRVKVELTFNSIIERIAIDLVVNA